MSVGSASSTWRGHAWQAASTSRWVCTTAFGFPVVPEVNAISATSSAEVRQGLKLPSFWAALASKHSASCPGSFIKLNGTMVCKVAFCALAMFSSSISAASHRASLICAFSITSPSSLARSNGMVATAINPAFTTPNQANAIPMELPPRNMTRLPGIRPKSSVSTCAMQLMRSLAS